MRLFIIFLLSGFFQLANAQQKIIVEINHMLGDEIFHFNQTSQNNLDHYFTLRRLDYYLSDFKIIHSGGQVMEVPNSISLVSLDDNQEKTQIDLGLLKVENIEKLSFMFGIDSVTNHSDPALYQVGHPLGPRFPTMHWGWASGYRFIAVEGKAGPANNQEMQLHALGDQYYRPFTFEVKPKVVGDTIKFELTADYRELFYNISIKQGVIVHGSDKEIVFMVDNVLQRVFSTSETSAQENVLHQEDMILYPNPSHGFFQVKSAHSDLIAGSVQIFNTQGQKVWQHELNGLVNTPYLVPGSYTVRIVNSKGETLQIKPLIVVP